MTVLTVTGSLLTNMVLTGNKILDSTIGQGFMNLLNDGIGAAQLIGGIIVVLVFIYISVKKSKAEEQERKTYSNWQIALLIIMVMIIEANDIFNLVKSYF